VRVNKKLIKWRRKYKEYHILRLGWIIENKKKNMEQWLNNNCSSDSNLYFSSFIRSYCVFLEETDAMAFKLRWM